MTGAWPYTPAVGLFSISPVVWVVLGLLFALALIRRMWRQWRTERAARRAQDAKLP
jgi:hypothetical protein